jgi:hypothetical protein
MKDLLDLIKIDENDLPIERDSDEIIFFEGPKVDPT